MTITIMTRPSMPFKTKREHVDKISFSYDNGGDAKLIGTKMIGFSKVEEDEER